MKHFFKAAVISGAVLSYPNPTDLDPVLLDFKAYTDHGEPITHLFRGVLKVDTNAKTPHPFFDCKGYEAYHPHAFNPHIKLNFANNFEMGVNGHPCLNHVENPETFPQYKQHVQEQFCQKIDKEWAILSSYFGIVSDLKRKGYRSPLQHDSTIHKAELLKNFYERNCP